MQQRFGQIAHGRRLVAKIGTGHSSEFLTSTVVELPVGLKEIRKSKEKKFVVVFITKDFFRRQVSKFKVHLSVNFVSGFMLPGTSLENLCADISSIFGRIGSLIGLMLQKYWHKIDNSI